MEIFIWQIIFSIELDAYKWIAQEIFNLKGRILYRDEGKFKKENENIIKNYFEHKKIRIITQKKDNISKIAQLFGQRFLCALRPESDSSKPRLILLQLILFSVFCKKSQ